MKLFRRDRPDAGLTLIETIAALFIFGIMTVGLVPLLIGSMVGAREARAGTVGKNVAVEAMERIRGLPYYVSYDTSAKRVDVLDLYYPCAFSPYSPTVTNGCPTDGGNYDGPNQRFVTTCTSSTTNPACPVDLPSAYTIVFCAQFVKAQDGAAYSAGTNPAPCATVPSGTSTIDFPAVQPTVGTYSWYRPVGSTNIDTPPTQLLQLSVTALWRETGSAAVCNTVPETAGCDSAQLSTVLGARRFGQIKISGQARVDHGLQVVTRFRDSSSPRGSTGLVTSTLTATVGGAESTTEQRLISSSTQSLDAATLSLTEDPTVVDPSQIDLPPSPFSGLAFTVRAPSDQAPAVPNGPAGVLRHEFVVPNKDVAGVAMTRAQTSPNETKVGVSAELPYAQGGFILGDAASTAAPGGPPGSGNSGLFYVDNQAVTTPSGYFFDPNQPMLSLRGSSGVTMDGRTSATTGALNTSGRGVFSSSFVRFNRLRLLPVDFLVGGPPVGPSAYDNAVFSITNFQARTTCKATAVGTTSGNGSVAGGDATEWTATAKFWSDPTDNGSTVGVTNPPAFQTVTLRGTCCPGSVTVSGSVTDTVGTLTYDGTQSFQTFIDNLKTRNVLVYDGSSALTDVYLFKDVTHINGYLRDWLTSAPTATYDTVNGLTASARIDEAMSIVTSPTDPTLEESGLSIAVGKLSCSVLDRR